MAQWERERTDNIKRMLSETKDEPAQIDRIAEIRGWFRPPEDDKFYPAVQEYIEGASDLQETVAKITKPIDDALIAQSDEHQLDDVWYPIIHTARRIPYSDPEQHNKLIHLVEALRGHPEPPRETNRSVYKTLSGLSMAARESFNDIPRHYVGSVLPEINAWTNINYFLARLTQARLLQNPIYAIWSMREALEKSPDPLPWWYDNYVPAAAVWVLGYGESLYRKEEDLTPRDPNQGNPARGGDLWTGGPVFSKDRWSFWKKRFSNVIEEAGIDNTTKKIAEQAVQKMNEIEQSR